jgi:hypothetical protein
VTSPPKAKRGVGRRRGRSPSAFEGGPSQRHADDDGHAERFTLLEGEIGGGIVRGGGRGRRKGGRAQGGKVQQLPEDWNRPSIQPNAVLLVLTRAAKLRRAEQLNDARVEKVGQRQLAAEFEVEVVNLADPDDEEMEFL